MNDPRHELLRTLPLSKQARQLIELTATPAELVEKLLERRQLVDAIYLLAWLLPPRQAVWWGCLSVWYANQGAATSPAESLALRQAVYWVFAPCASYQTAALESARTAGTKTAAGTLAAAAYFGGSAANEQETVQPVSHASVAGGVASAVFLAAVALVRSGKTAHNFEAYSQLIQVARDITFSPKRWEDQPIAQEVVCRLYS